MGEFFGVCVFHALFSVAQKVTYIIMLNVIISWCF